MRPLGPPPPQAPPVSTAAPAKLKCRFFDESPDGIGWLGACLTLKCNVQLSDCRTCIFYKPANGPAVRDRR